MALMKKGMLLTSFLALWASVPSAQASSVLFEAFAPLYGVDLQWRQMKPSGYWDGMFVQNMWGIDAFIGAKFFENFGINIGWEETGKSPKGVLIPPGSVMAGGAINNTGGSVTVKSRARLSGFYLDLIGYFPTENGFEIFATIGTMWARTTIDFEPLQPINAPYIAALSSITGHHNMITRLGIGGLWMATDNVGLRAKIGWEGTSRLKLSDNKQYGFNAKIFRSSISFSLGIFSYLN